MARAQFKGDHVQTDTADEEQARKRERASQMEWTGPVAERRPDYGPLTVDFGSPFDCGCYMATVETLATKYPDKYSRLVDHLVAETGCTEEELIAHGEKVRAYLYFGLGRMTRDGQTVARKSKFALPVVRPAF